MEPGDPFETSRGPVAAGSFDSPMDETTGTVPTVLGSPTDTQYGSAPAAHVRASASALTLLADLVTGDFRRHNAKPIHVQLSHYEHGAFLSPLLYTFPLMRSTRKLIEDPAGPLLRKLPPAFGLRSPDTTSPEEPFVSVVVANHSLSAQIETTLSTLSMLVARQKLVRDGARPLSEVDRLTSEADAHAISAVRDALRTEGWRAAAAAVRARAEASDIPLIVSYNSTLLPREDITQRAPILRRIYNELVPAQAAVDKLATTLSQGLISTGGSSQAVGQFARTLLDSMSARTYLAHLARDAFVCGNGYLSFGSVPDEDIHLLPPESVEIIDKRKVKVEVDGRFQIHSNVLHIRGAEQVGSIYGVSALEPFVQLQIELETMNRIIEISEAWRRPEVPQNIQDVAHEKVPLARRRITALHAKAESLLGGARTLNVIVPNSLYFPGYERMKPAAERISMVDSTPPTTMVDESS